MATSTALPPPVSWSASESHLYSAICTGLSSWRMKQKTKSCSEMRTGGDVSVSMFIAESG
jgi:hypothetical protein